VAARTLSIAAPIRLRWTCRAGELFEIEHDRLDPAVVRRRLDRADHVAGLNSFSGASPESSSCEGLIALRSSTMGRRA
jgi:hypothetical protein